MEQTRAEAEKTRVGKRKAVFLGIDGMDPKIAEGMMQDGLLPAFSKLAKAGTFSPLRTVDPPQSPVVWASIATGLNPGEHGIYDFLERDPSNYLLGFSIMKLRKSGYVPPFECLTFWEKAAGQGVPVKVLRWPLTFPPRRMKQGSLLAGLGVPDIQGRLGRYQFFTTDMTPVTADTKGRVIEVKPENGRIETTLAGPMAGSLKGPKETTVPLSITISGDTASCSVGGEEFTLTRGQWSNWVTLGFKLGVFQSTTGLCRFYLKSASPEFSLYVTPINVAPSSDAFPVSWPKDYAAELARATGDFATLGMPEDTNSLNDGLMDEGAFLQMCDSIMKERERMFLFELERFQDGLLACVFDTTDRVSHMFWRFRDQGHPFYDEALAKHYGRVVEDYYARMDKVLEKVLASVGDDTLVLACSDHGFSSFRRSVHLNTWLRDNGYLTLTDGQASSKGLFENVNWAGTRAYACGLNSLYLNLKGRDKEGSVTSADVSKLTAELKGRLLDMRDQDLRPIRGVHLASEIYHGPEAHRAPDIIMGYDGQYRQSWQTAIGGLPEGPAFEDNARRWSGDHCSDKQEVPGVLFSNQGGFGDDPSVVDIAPTILAYLGVN